MAEKLESLVGELLKLLNARIDEARSVRPDAQFVQVNIFIGDVSMSKYQVTDAPGSIIGDNPQHNTITNLTAATDKIDSKKLAEELSALRIELKKKANPENSDHDAAIGSVAQAEKEAKAGNTSKALEYLKAAGGWALDVAKSTASGILKDYLEGKIGAA